MTPDKTGKSRGSIREGAIAATFLALAVMMTWPLGNLARAPLPDLNDAMFNVWRLAWIAHQLRADPAHLFDGNIFFPEPNTLAYSDAILLPGLLGTPLIWLGVHPFVVHNLLVIAAFWLAGYCAYRFGLRVTGLRWPSIVCGVIFAFVPYRYGHIAHLELLWTAFVPLGVLALLRLMEQPSALAGLRLAACHVLQTLCSVYYGVYFAIYLAAATGLMLFGRPRVWLAPRAKALAVAALTAAVVLLPYAARYHQASKTVAGRNLDETIRYSAVPGDYLRVSRDNKVHLGDTSEGFEERALFPGVVAATLAVLGVASRTRAVVIHTILLVFCVDLSFGMNGLVYPRLLAAVPFLVGLRAPARFGALVTFELAVLAAVGAARLMSWRPSMRWVGPVLAAACLLEYWAVPIKSREWSWKPPPVYAWLAQQPRGVVLELPVPHSDRLWTNETEFQLMSIYHWQPLINGYSGHAPASYLRRLDALQDFPSATSLQELRRTGVRWIVVHERLTGNAEFAELMQRCLESGALRVTQSFPDQTWHSAVLELIPE